MKMKFIAAATSLFIITFSSCKKESVADASTFSYQIKTSNALSTVNKVTTSERSDAASIEWTGGTAYANLIKFEAKNNSGEIEFKQNVQQQIDLFASTASLGNITIPAGTYSQVEFKAFFAPSANNPALQLTGNFTSNGISKPVSFTVNENTELKAEKSNITVATGTAYSALTTIDLSQLTRGISQASLANAGFTNGTIIISATSNIALYNSILNNLNSHHGEAEIAHH